MTLKFFYQKIYHGSHIYLLLLQKQTGSLDYLKRVLGRGRKLYLLVKFIKGNSDSNIDDYTSSIEDRVSSRDCQLTFARYCMSSSNSGRTRNSHNHKPFKPYCETNIFKNSVWNR